MGMVLAKTDIEIGRRYADVLVDDATVRDEIFGTIVAEHTRAMRWHARITGSRRPARRQPGRWPAACATATRTSTRCT